MLIGVAGMVGAGKSTLTRALAVRFGLQLAPESVGDDNPWLEPYYGGGAESMRRIRGQGGGWVLDRTWYEDAEVFARGLWEDGVMDAAEWTLYQRLYGELLHSPAARPPRLLVYLHGPLDVITGRIARRGRAGERETPVDYWAALHRRYEHWIAGFRRAPVLRIDVREYDLVEDPQAIDRVAARLRARLEPELPQVELWPDAGAELAAAR